MIMPFTASLAPGKLLANNWQDSRHQFTDNLAEQLRRSDSKLVDVLCDRVLKASPLRDTVLDETSLWRSVRLPNLPGAVPAPHLRTCDSIGGVACGDVRRSRQVHTAALRNKVW